MTDARFTRVYGLSYRPANVVTRGVSVGPEACLWLDPNMPSSLIRQIIAAYNDGRLRVEIVRAP